MILIRNNSNMRQIYIAIDGEAGSGKGTLAKSLSLYFKFPHIDTGKLYRLFAYKISNQDLTQENIDKYIAEVKNEPDFGNPHITSEEVGKITSIISQNKNVRNVMTKLQKEMAEDISQQHNGVILDGRDIGTVILPNANVKLFLTAKNEVKAQRRYEELKNADYNEILQKIIERDNRDKERENAPLKPADDAIIIDTSYMTQEEVLNQAIEICEKQLNI